MTLEIWQFSFSHPDPPVILREKLLLVLIIGCVLNPHNVPFLDTVIQPSELATRSNTWESEVWSFTWCRIHNVWLQCVDAASPPVGRATVTVAWGVGIQVTWIPKWELRVLTKMLLRRSVSAPHLAWFPLLSCFCLWSEAWGHKHLSYTSSWIPSLIIYEGNPS